LVKKLLNQRFSMKNKYFLLLILVMMGYSQSYGQDSDYSQKLLDRLYAIQNRTPNARKAGEHGHEHCLSMLLREAKTNQNLLTPAAKKAFKILDVRPTIAGAVTYQTTHFLFHYTTTGTDALKDLTDASSNGIPDIIDSMAAIFEHVYQVDTLVLKYYMPPSDGTTGGGNNLYDVYVSKIGTGLYGYVNSETTVGNNPNSPNIVESDATTSWMAMNSDYTWVAQYSSISPIEAIKVTAAHEYYHAVQYGITSNSSIFFAESTACWMEDEMYPGIDDNLQYLPDLFNNPDIALDLHENEISSNFDGYWYAGWIFWKYVTEHTDTDILRQIWILAIEQYENDAYNIALNNYGTDFKTMFKNWQIANYVLDNNSGYAPYTYNRGPDYKDYIIGNTNLQGIFTEGIFTYTGKDTTWYSNGTNPPMGNGRLMRLSADYLEIRPDQNFNVIVIPSDINQGITPYLIKVNTSNKTISVMTGTMVLGNQYEIEVTDQPSYDKFILIVSRYDAYVTNDVSGSAQYTIRLGNVTPTAVVTPETLVTNLYPNPAREHFEIDYSSGMVEEILIMDYTGKLLLSSKVENSNLGKQSIDCSLWNNGIYFVILKDKNGLIAKEKVVISK
jgi:hypothetical protein